MPINQTIMIRGSVGFNGRNDPADVMAVQRQLNGQMRPPRQQLIVDGRCGPKTNGMIADFQRVVVGVHNPDSRVDPNGRTLAALNDPMSEGRWAMMSIAPTPAPGTGAVTGLSPIEQQRLEALRAAVPAGNPEGLLALEFISYLATNEVATLKVLLNVQGAIQYPVDMMRAFARMRAAGFTAQEILWIIREANRFGAGRLDNALEAMRLVGRSTRAASVLKSLGNIATVLQVLATAVVVIDHFRRGRYGAGFAEIYGAAMGIAIPLAGFLNAVQELLYAANPNIQSDTRYQAAFRFLLAIEPISAGKTAVDTAVTFIEMAIRAMFGGGLRGDELDQLVRRMRESPMRYWTEIGDSMGDWMGDRFGDWYYRNFLQ